MEDKISTGEAWGLSAGIDLKGCDINLIKDIDYVREFVIDLCEFIKMKRYGELWIDRFGPKEHLFGITFLQPIETSSLSGHFCESDGSVYLDVFSCACYDPEAVLEFSLKYFKGTTGKLSHSVWRV